MSQKTSEILKQLETGVKELMRSDNYKHYLRFISSFRQYSLRNSLLIYLQRPDATFVAPYTEWQKKHRHVKKGEKGIAIFSPHQLRKRDDASGEDRNNIGFHLSYTYDISQTEADDPLGDMPVICKNLSGTLDDRSKLDILISISPVKVEFQPVNGTANGFYSPSEQKIVVDNTNSETQQLKTLIHEQAHCRHHQADPAAFDKLTRNEREIVAESVAYAVCSHLGIDSSGYSFGYLLGWGDTKMKEFQEHLNVIKKITDSMLMEIETQTDILLYGGECKS